MVCKHYGICDFIRHIEKMVELEELPEDAKKELRNFLLDIERDFCNGDTMGINVYHDGVMTITECDFSDVTCCPRFPDCSVVRSRQTLFIDDLARLCIETCTSLGEGRCIEMGESDFNIMFEGGTDIVLSRPIKEKFKGL